MAVEILFTAQRSGAVKRLQRTAGNSFKTLPYYCEYLSNKN